MATIKELIVKITTNAKQAKDDIKNFGKATKDAGKEADKASDGVGKISDATVGLSTGAEKAKDNTHKLTDKVKGMIAPVKDAGDALNVMKGALGAFGITVGIQQLVQAFGDMATKAKEARDEYNRTKTEFLDYTGTLTQAQTDMANAIYQRSQSSEGFTDKSQVTKAVAYTGIYFAEGTQDQQKEIAQNLATYQALNQISDTASYAQTAKEAFVEWGVGINETASTLEYLFSVAQASGMKMDTLTQELIANGDSLMALGYSIEDSADIIGKANKEYGTTSGLTSVLDNYDPNEVDESTKALAEEQAKSYIDNLSVALDKVSKKASEIWKEKIIGNPSLMTEIQQATYNDQQGANPTDLASWYIANTESANIILNEALTKYGKQIGQIEANRLNRLIDEDTSLQDVLDMLDAEYGSVVNLNEDGYTPLNNSVEQNNTLSQWLVDFTNNVLQPALVNEGNVVLNLIKYYKDLAEAKAEAGEA